LEAAALRAAASAGPHPLPPVRTVRLTIGAPGLWPYAAGIALALESKGYRVAVSPTGWVSYFGPNPDQSARPVCTLVLDPAGPTTPPSLAVGVALAAVDGIALRQTSRP
ncbi:MAG TPA: hypothetical protein VFP61_08130, partial [Acidimicrobiales bacterium]|nr:hypothetical protein [Acidimicrobiales bacterium]